jgi:hypothetical protein
MRRRRPPALVRIAATAAALAGLVPSPAAGEPERVPIADGRAAIALPAGWVELDPVLLELLTDELALVTGGLTTERYQHGFRPADRLGGPFGPPLVLVQIRDSGRVPYRDLAAAGGALPRPDEPDEFARGTRPNLRGLTMERIVFDRSRLVIRAVGRFDRPSIPPTEIRSAAYLTSHGTLTVHGYLETPTSPEEGAAVDAMLDGIELGPELRYRPRLRERLAAAALRPGTWYTAAVLTFAVLVVVTIRGLRRGRR